ncbi:hypothetical protein MNBD_GAMMA26-2633 [hydrothermal vent metagenome]|uniref:AsmA domain-containing protein n=1 Tax=hydrothermal vent metagenome TaxID=652676 RepID=A0A3B1B630_9ZZZZ
MNKQILAGLGVLMVVLVAVAVYVTNNLNDLIVEAVEAFGAPVTQTEVKLESSDISFFSGEGTLNGLLIGNPEGYTGTSAFELGSLQVVLNSESSGDDVAVIKSIDIANPIITYESGGQAGSNLQQILENIAGFQGGGPKIVIDRVTISDGQIKIVTPLSGDGLSAPLPTIELTGIGREDGGITPEEAFRMVMEKIVAQVQDITSRTED